ncbi:MAG: hypothetical protein QMD09_13275 [Desulfatibacillaceae bacterium]|nr:hypothetical protein [Desulfatibacillaceae bacterium]
MCQAAYGKNFQLEAPLFLHEAVQNLLVQQNYPALKFLTAKNMVVKAENKVKKKNKGKKAAMEKTKRFHPWTFAPVLGLLFGGALFGLGGYSTLFNARYGGLYICFLGLVVIVLVLLFQRK